MPRSARVRHHSSKRIRVESSANIPHGTRYSLSDGSNVALRYSRSPGSPRVTVKKKGSKDETMAYATFRRDHRQTDRAIEMWEGAFESGGPSVDDDERLG